MSVSGSHCVLKTSGCINVRKENSSVNLYEKRVKSSTSTTTSSKEYINIGKYDCYPGVDIVTFTRGSKSLEKCKTECNKNDKCKYIMSVSGSHCVLKTSGCINVRKENSSVNLYEKKVKSSTSTTTSSKAKDCKTTPKGSEYAGTKYTHTKSGKICQMWDSQYPNKHSKKAANFPEKSLKKAKNYCRNPDGEAKPWCYIGVPHQGRWEFCD